VLQAGDSGTPQAASALEVLCRNYWSPLYAFVRRRGYSPEDAQDLIQEFFSRLIARKDFARVDRNKGKFRSFLLGALNHFLAKEWRDEHTLRRGGGAHFISLDAIEWEERFASQTPFTLPPETVYDRQWALAVLNQALTQIKAEMDQANRTPFFEAVKHLLVESTQDGDYGPLAQRLAMSPAAVRMAVLRLRQQFREAVRAVITGTVTTPLELEEELLYLRSVLAE